MAVLDYSLRAETTEPRLCSYVPGPLACVGIGVVSVAIVGVAAALGPLAGIGALIMVAISLATLANPAFGAMIVVGLAPATSGLARGLPIPGLRLSEIVTCGIGSLIILTRRRRSRVGWGPFEWLALAYVVGTAGLGGYDLIARGEPFTTLNLGTLFGPLQFLIMYLVVASAINTDALRRGAIGILLLSSIPVSILAIMQQFNIAGVRQLLVTLTGTNIYETSMNDVAGVVPRATGPFPHWHQLGAFLAIIIVILVAVLLDRRVKILKRPILLGILLLASVALIQTVTITAIMIALAGVLVIGHWYGSLKRVLAVLVPLAVIAAIVFAPLLLTRYHSQFTAPVGTSQNSLVPSTVAYRYEVWTNQWFPLLNGRWLTGFGPDTPSNVAWPYPESLYLEMVLRGGIPLLIILLALVVVWGARAGPLTNSEDPTRRLLARVTVYLMVALGVAHIIVPYFVDSGEPHLLWLIAGLTFGGLSRQGALDRAPRVIRRIRPRLNVRPRLGVALDTVR